MAVTTPFNISRELGVNSVELSQGSPCVVKTSSCNTCHIFLSILIPLVLRQLQSMKGLYYTEYPGCGTVLCVLVSPTSLDSSSASYGEVSISDARPLARR